MSITQLVQKFVEISDAKTGNPQSEEDIERLENSLSVTFPDQYKAFLKNFGYLDSSDGEIHGASTAPELSVFDNTLYFRNFEVPANFEPICQHGIVLDRYIGGGFYFLHSMESSKRGEIGLHLDETRWSEAESWPNLASFLIYMIEIAKFS